MSLAASKSLPALALGISPRAGVLLPRPLKGPYDYKLPLGTNASRGSVVSAPLGTTEVLGVVWCEAEGSVGDNRLKEATPLEGGPRLPVALCDFIDWVAEYTLNPVYEIAKRHGKARPAFERCGLFQTIVADAAFP